MKEPNSPNRTEALLKSAVDGAKGGGYPAVGIVCVDNQVTLIHCYDIEISPEQLQRAVNAAGALLRVLYPGIKFDKQEIP